MWRISPQTYRELISYDGADATFELLSGHGFKDYASLTADEAAVNVMLQSTDLLAGFIVGEVARLDRVSPHGNFRSRLEHRPNHKLKQFVESAEPGDEQFTEAVIEAYRTVYDREPDDAQRDRFLALLRETSDEIGHWS